MSPRVDIGVPPLLLKRHSAVAGIQELEQHKKTHRMNGGLLFLDKLFPGLSVALLVTIPIERFGLSSGFSVSYDRLVRV